MKLADVAYLARSVISLRAQQLGRFRSIADMVGPATGLVPVENDPERTSLPFAP